MKRKKTGAVLLAVLFAIALILLGTIYLGLWGRGNGKKATDSQTAAAAVALFDW